MKAVLMCHCGQRIFSRDVMQQGRLVRSFGSSYIYIRFRCSRCKKLGEQYIKQEDWDFSTLVDATSEVSQREKQRFDRMGPITADEVRDVRRRMTDLRTLPAPHTDDKASN